LWEFFSQRMSILVPWMKRSGTKVRKESSSF
jgi:hypothetical protein